jgi:hydroxyacylglutathione hydrolase
MYIQQVKYSKDNLGYLLYSAGEGIAIDAGGVEETLAFAQENDICIKYVSNTHSHYDHTPGNKALLQHTAAKFIDCCQLKSDQVITLGQKKLELIPTPGHTDDSITFKTDEFMITGDTLFNGTVGNCFSGDLQAFFNSLERLISFPRDIKIYGGHDYVLESMTVAKLIEKDNPYIEEYLKRYNPDLIVSTLADELKVNPYIRFNAPDIITLLEENNLPADTAFERFTSLMEDY